MKIELRNDIKYPHAMAALSILALLFSVAAAFLGELIIALAVAPLAAIIAFEKNEKRFLSYIIPVLILAVNFLINGLLSVIGIEIVTVAITIGLMYKFGRSKTECVLAVTVIMSLMLALSLAFAAMNETGVRTLESVMSFYKNGFEAMKKDFVEQLTSLTENMGDGTEMLVFPEEQAIALFDMLANMLISIMIIVAFALSGIIFKAYSALVLRISSDPERILKWRFMTPSIFAYFYIALFVLYLLLGASTDVFAISVMNLYNVFTYVYAYFGFGYAVAIFSRGRSRGFAVAIIIAAILITANLAIEILAFLGVFYTITYNKFNTPTVTNKEL